MSSRVSNSPKDSPSTALGEAAGGVRVSVWVSQIWRCGSFGRIATPFDDEICRGRDRTVGKGEKDFLKREGELFSVYVFFRLE